jgi:hypothetical protein
VRGVCLRRTGGVLSVAPVPGSTSSPRIFHPGFHTSIRENLVLTAVQVTSWHFMARLDGIGTDLY